MELEPLPLLLVPLLSLPVLEAPTPADGDGDTQATPLPLPLPELLPLGLPLSLLLVPLLPLPVPDAPTPADGDGDTAVPLLLPLPELLVHVPPHQCCRIGISPMDLRRHSTCKCLALSNLLRAADSINRVPSGRIPQHALHHGHSYCLADLHIHGVITTARCQQPSGPQNSGGGGAVAGPPWAPSQERTGRTFVVVPCLWMHLRRSGVTPWTSTHLGLILRRAKARRRLQGCPQGLAVAGRMHRCVNSL